jgi:hypothetical protein
MTWYKTQAEALKSMTEQQHSILVKKGDYEFGSFGDQEAFIDYIEECKPVDRIFYEVLIANHPQRMFSDIDGEGLSITREEVYQQWEKLMSEVLSICGLAKYNVNKVKLLNSTGDKISGHWSYLPGDRVFRNSSEQKKFWQYVEHVIEDKYFDLCFTKKRADGKTELRTVLDISVYNNNRAMRTIYSHKEGSSRVLMPVRLRNGKLKTLKNVNPQDYLIYVEPYSATEFFEPKIPPYTKLKKSYKKQESIEELILKSVPNVEVSELTGRLFKLKTVGTRKCILGGETNETDNCFVIWKRDGLYFGCHDSECEGKLKKIQELAKPMDALPAGATLVDLRQMALKCKTFEQRRTLIDACVAWFNRTHCLIKANKTFVLEEFKDIDEDDEYTVGIKYKDLKSVVVDFSNKNLTTSLTDAEIEKHKKVLGPNPQTVSTYGEWIKHVNRREVDKIIFDPKIYYNPTPDSKRFYNLFDGFEISRESVKNVQIEDDFEDQAFFDHLLQRWCSGDFKAYNIVLNVFAHILQKPWEKLNISVILRSTERTGKGLPINIFKRIIGSKYFFQPSNPKQVLGDFNSGMKSCLFLFLDEMVWGGDKEKAGTLKKLVTESSNYINEKFAPVIKVKNNSMVFMASNEDWVVPAGATEQRWLVLNVSDELATCPKPQKNKIVSDIRSIDIRMLAKFLYDRDLAGWSHRETVNTQGLRDQKIQSLSAIRRWWLDELHNENLRFNTWTNKKSLYQSYQEESADKRHMTERKFWIDMKHILGKDFRQKRVMEMGARKLKILLPSIERCRERWRELYNDEGWGFGISDDEDATSDPNQSNEEE